MGLGKVNKHTQILIKLIKDISILTDLILLGISGDIQCEIKQS